MSSVVAVARMKAIPDLVAIILVPVDIVAEANRLFIVLRVLVDA